MDLNDREAIQQLDPKNVFGSTEAQLDQAQEMYDELADIEFKQDFSNVQNVVFSGMGGSALGAQVAVSLFKDKLKVPTYINNDYDLPEFVNENTLVILTSYSGSTEETIASFAEAEARQAKIIGFATGGRLAEVVNGGGFDMVEYTPTHNPCGQPRLATGYSVVGTISILEKIGLLQMDSTQLTHALDTLRSRQEEIKATAQDVSQKLQGNIPVIFAGGVFAGNAHIMRNQFNETAKSFASYHIIPEANHHVMEGLKNPPERKLYGIFFNSNLYPEKIVKRMSLTNDVVEKNGVSTYLYDLNSENRIEQSLELLLFGGYVTFYLGILYGLDPSLIPWVDYFKEKLAQ